MADLKMVAEDMTQLEYKATLFDIISNEVESSSENPVGFYGFVFGVCCAYESWERDIHEFK